MTWSGDTVIRVCAPRLPDAAALRPYLEEIDANRFYTNFGPLARRFERRLAERFDLPAESCATVGNGTLGLVLALKAADLPPGSLCLLPSWTFCATAHAVIAAGLRPYFVDVHPDSWALEPRTALLESARAPGPVCAVIAVAPFGAPVNTAAWDAFAEQTGIAVVIDAAAGFDAARPGRAALVVSLHATKTLGVGEGGVVLSQDAALVKKIRKLSNFGFGPERAAAFAALNGKISEYTAAIGLAALDAWPRMRVRFVELARLYAEHLAPVGGAALRSGFGTEWVSSTCMVEVNDCDTFTLAARLAERGVETRCWWGEGCHAQPAFRDFPRGPLTVSERLARRAIGLPFHSDLDAASIARVASALGAVLHELRVEAEAAKRPAPRLRLPQVGRWP